MADCGGCCTDLQSDNDHCGTCGNKCDVAAGFICTAGQCECLVGLTDCSGKCVDLTTDNYNCGSCGNACLITDCDGKLVPCAILKGMCPSPCPSGTCLCDLACVDIQTDPANCGACNNKCTGGKTCQSGVCTCPTTLPDDCNGVCVDTQNDPMNCGACGIACTGSACPPPLCKYGMCTTCGPGMCDCNGTCVDLQTDHNNCGTCGNVCTVYEVCSSGECVLISPPTTPMITVTCPSTSLPAGTAMQCTATGTLPNGATVNLTTVVTWSTANNGPCAAAAGIISPTGTGPPGTFTAVTAGCKSDVSASYTPTGGATIKSNIVTISVTS